jgi:hypothetical protein
VIIVHLVSIVLPTAAEMAEINRIPQRWNPPNGQANEGPGNRSSTTEFGPRFQGVPNASVIMQVPEETAEVLNNENIFSFFNSLSRPGDLDLTQLRPFKPLVVKQHLVYLGQVQDQWISWI